MAKERRNLDNVSMERERLRVGKGKRHHQKIKPYVVLQYLLKYTDEEHVISADAIVQTLIEEYEIDAEKRAIYSDINEINAVALMLRDGGTITEAAAMLEEDKSDDLRMIIYDPHRKGFYVRERSFALDELRLLAECVYTARFITQGTAKRIIDGIGDFTSVYQQEKIKHDVEVVDRAKTNNTQVLINVDKLNKAIKGYWEDNITHKPCKVSFHYLQYEINNVKTQVERRKGKPYIVSPYKLLINEGNYYLLAYNEQRKKIFHYRIDRMRNVSLLEELREGQEAYDKLDIRTYARSVFGMYKGDRKTITIRFLFTLLDTMVERFGTNARYEMMDEKHYSVTTEVEISPQFYGWLLGFGRKAKIISPLEAVEEFKAYVDKIREMYVMEDKK